MRNLLKYLKDYKKECVFAPLFKALEAGFELIVPLVIAHMIDDGIPADDGKLIVRCGLLLIALGFVGFASAVIAQFFAAKAAVGFSTKLRHDLFEKSLRFSFSKLDEVGTSTLLTRLTSDVSSVQAGVNMVLRLFLRSPYIVIGATIMAFFIDFKSALIFVVLIVVLFLIVFFLAYSNIGLLEKAQQKLDAVTASVRENLSGTRVIRAFCRQDERRQDFAGKNRELFLAQKKAGVRSALLNPITYVIINLFIVWLVRIGAVQVGNGVLTAGQVIALYNYMSQILIELIKFANLLITVNKALSGGRRIAAVLAMQDQDTADIAAGQGQPDSNDGMEDRAPAVSFEHVSMKYHESADEVLSDIDFHIDRGETLGIIGGTGAGKSTLAHLIPGFYRASKGRVFVNGLDVNKQNPKELTSLVGIAMQKPVLFSGTIADNLRWGNPGASDEDLMQAVRLSCCEEVLTEHGGLEAEVLQGGKNFSGGQRQRLCIARALVKHPSILILDDSFSALDYVTDRKLRDHLRTLEDMTLIMISQRTVSIQECDHILVLDDGRMEGFGTHEDLLENCSIYRQIYHSQGRDKEEEGGRS